MLVEHADESFPPGTELSPSTGLKKSNSVEYTLALSLEDTDGDDWSKSVFDNTPEFRDFLFQRDVPRQSIEDESPERSSCQSVRSTPSSTTRVPSHESESTRDDISDTENGLRDLKLDSEAADQSSRPKTPTLSTPLFSPELPDNKPQVAENLDATPNRLRSDSYLATPGPHRQASSLSPSPSSRRGRRSMTPNEKVLHRVEDEELPQTVFFSPTVQQTLLDARSCISRIANLLSSTDLHHNSGSTIESLHQQASELADWKLPSCIVGLVGDSGTGKSTLINSLLDKRDLARSSDKGFACTSVVTEFVYHDQDNYIIHVDRFSLKEIRPQLEDLLITYREGKVPREDPSQHSEDTEDPNVDKPSQQEVDAATSTLRSIFRDDFQKLEEDFCAPRLNDAIDFIEESAFNILLKSSDEEPFGTVEQCASRLAELTSQVHNTSSATSATTPWFFVRSVKVCLKAHILSQGLILADLPGLRDVNPMRARATERYIRQCHHMFAVVEINRAATNQSVEDIFELAKDAHLGKIDIVCTKAEVDKVRNVALEEASTQGEMNTLIKTYKDTERKISSCQEEIQEIEETLKAEQIDIEDDPELKQLHHATLDEKMKAENSLEVIKSKLQSLVMKQRNENVTSALQKRYKSKQPKSALHVFCVSNTLYCDNRNKPVNVARPQLELSGIIQLRKYCIKIAAEGCLSAARKLVNHELPALLGSIELWLKATDEDATALVKQKMHNTIAIIEIILAQFTARNAPVNNVSDALEAKFDKQIYHHLQNNTDMWRASAKKASYDWHGLHYTSHLAWCRNDGIHSTRKVEFCNWNKKATEHMQTDMDPIWDGFIKDTRSPLKPVRANADALFEKMRRCAKSLTTNGSDKVTSLKSVVQALERNLKIRQGLMHRYVEENELEFSRKIVDIKVDTLGGMRTGFTVECMQDTYRKAQDLNGIGSTDERKDLVTQRFGSKALFEDIQNLCREKYQEAAKSLQDSAHQMIKKQVALIKRDLEGLKSTEIVVEGDPGPEIRRRMRAEMESVRQKYLMIF